MKSNLATLTDLSPNNSGRRQYDITRITPHIVVGDFDAQTVASWFADTKRKASANYIIGKSGEILCNVEEQNRAWTSGSFDNDNRAITIECASGLNYPYELKPEVYESLIKLTVDICQRYNKKRIVWYDDKLLRTKPKDDELLITAHYFFQNVECFGKWLKDKMPEFVKTVNERLNDNIIYRVQVGAFKNKDNAERLRDKLRSEGYTDAFITERR